MLTIIAIANLVIHLGQNGGNTTNFVSGIPFAPTVKFNNVVWICSLIARFMGPTWGSSGADRTQVDPMLAPWTLLSGLWDRPYTERNVAIWSVGPLHFDVPIVCMCEGCRRGAAFSASADIHVHVYRSVTYNRDRWRLQGISATYTTLA